MGAKRVTADYAVPFGQVWEHLGPVCGLNRALVKNKKNKKIKKTNVLLKRLQCLKITKRRKTVEID